MTKITGIINYTLEIDPTDEQHKLSYDNKFENDIVALMMSSQVLTIQLGQWKEYKKIETDSKKKKYAGKRIADCASALRAIKPLMLDLLNTYDDFVAHQAQIAAEKLNEFVQQGVEPKAE